MSRCPSPVALRVRRTTTARAPPASQCPMHQHPIASSSRDIRIPSASRRRKRRHSGRQRIYTLRARSHPYSALPPAPARGRHRSSPITRSYDADAGRGFPRIHTRAAFNTAPATASASGSCTPRAPALPQPRLAEAGAHASVHRAAAAAAVHGAGTGTRTIPAPGARAATNSASPRIRPAKPVDAHHQRKA
ncbi:hypothetical protein C8R47DRAFT_1160813 [Mycena vitilis]|nr:hypothetical protein C8R47DRAFT_1160813 [Mycena vitilis]